MKRFLKFAAALALPTLWAPLPAPARSAEARPPVKQVLKSVDDLYRGKTSLSEVEMTVVTPDWKRTMDAKAWSEGLDKTFIVLLSPHKDAGIATLRVKNEMWNYFPRINKTLKVPPSMMMGSWMGSDFTNDDLVKESTFLDDYNGRWLPDSEGPPGTWTLELTPKAQTATVWARILVSLRPGGLLPVQDAYFDEHGEKVRVMHYRDVRKIGSREIPMEMELDPLKKPGHRTVLKYKSLKFDVPLAASVFSLQNLRRAR